MKDYSTWVKHRNEKRCAEEGRKNRFPLPYQPSPKLRHPVQRETSSLWKKREVAPAFSKDIWASPPQLQPDSCRNAAGHKRVGWNTQTANRKKKKLPGTNTVPSKIIFQAWRRDKDCPKERKAEVIHYHQTSLTKKMLQNIIQAEIKGC